MDIDDLKNNWNSLTIPPDYHPETDDVISRVEQGRVSTLRDRLGRISRMLSLICVGGVMMMVPYLHESMLMGLLAIGFFVLMGVLHFLSYLKVMRLNFSEMTVRDAILTVGRLERNRVRLRAIGMVLGIPLVVYMCFTFTEVFGEYYLYGCICGGLVGMVIGLLINRRAVNILREMRAQLEQD